MDKAGTDKPVTQRPKQIPSIGHVVHYKLPFGPDKGGYRPAIIVRIFDTVPQPDSLVQLQVFLDGGNDTGYGDGRKDTLWATSVHHDETGTEFGTWKWPPYVPAK